MNISKILYATDFSACSMAALDYASSLAASFHAKLYILHVDDTTPGMVFGEVGYGYVPEVDEITREEYETLHDIVPTNSEVQYEHLFARGDAAKGILKIAEKKQVDLIVIGTHGQTGLARVLMGSVAEEVVRNASSSVLTVKLPVNELSHAEPGQVKKKESGTAK